jgi:BlaI family penicillinase repressor
LGKLADLAPAEFEAMEVLWDKGESSTKEVLAALSKERKLAYNTVATVLTRLREKGYVEAREQNFAYVYRPIVDRSRVVDRKLDDLVGRIFKGSVAPLAVYISKKRKLTPEQVAALEEIIRSQPDEES